MNKHERTRALGAAGGINWCVGAQLTGTQDGTLEQSYFCQVSLQCSQIPQLSVLELKWYDTLS